MLTHVFNRPTFPFWKLCLAQKVPVFPGVQSASYSDALLAAHPSFLPSLRGQYWNRREAEENRERDRKQMETDESYRVLLEMADAALANNPDFAEQGPFENPYAPSVLSGEVDGGFWEMKSTGGRNGHRRRGTHLVPWSGGLCRSPGGVAPVEGGTLVAGGSLGKDWIMKTAA